jgi:hypothetical protein
MFYELSMQPSQLQCLVTKAGKLSLHEDQYTYGSSRQEKIAAHRGYYNSFIRHASNQQLSKDRVPEDDLHMGLDPWAGMGTGDPGFKPKPGPLWLADANLPAKCAHFKGFPTELAASIPAFEVWPTCAQGVALLWLLAEACLPDMQWY